MEKGTIIRLRRSLKKNRARTYGVCVHTFEAPLIGLENTKNPTGLLMVLRNGEVMAVTRSEAASLFEWAGFDRVAAAYELRSIEQLRVDVRRGVFKHALASEREMTR